jgi:hypothetical protein
MRFISIFSGIPMNRLPTEAEMASMHKLIVEGMKAGWLIECEGVSFGSPATCRTSTGDRGNSVLLPETGLF